MVIKSLGYIAALSIAVLGRAGAQAVEVPDATIDYSVGGQGEMHPQLSNATFTGSSCGGPGDGGCETDSVSMTTSLLLQTSGTGSNAWSASPGITATVYYEVVGPADTQAQVTISGYGSVSLSAQAGYGFSSIDADIGSPSAVCVSIGNGVCDGYPTGTAGLVTQVKTINSDTVYAFEMTSTCEALGGTCSSALDPTIKITSGNALDFNVEISPNVSAVPEPGTLPLIALGLGGLTWIMRRRQQGMFS